jgi:Xaa-Pro aminopeptidase
MLTHYRYSLAPSIIEEMKGVKCEVEIQGLKRAHRRDGACYVQFLAWMDEKMSKGFEISEWEAAWRLNEFRRKAKNYMGLAYETISASGPNAAFPHYHPLKSDRYIISKDIPYINDSGGQYRDGTCDTSRTMHYGSPTLEQSEAYTRVLQGHVGGFKKKILHANACSSLVPVDRYRHRCLPKGHDRCPTGCPCAEEFMAGRSELSRELIHVFDLFD